ncbi:MAG: DUF3306 domain-containing protein [Acidiferrobacterales bacterium]
MNGRPGKKGNTVDTRAGEAGKTGESRLARWSRRKAATRNQDTPIAEHAIKDRHEIRDNHENLNSEPIKAPTDDDMPPLESLDEHSDYSGFLSPGVSEKLRKQALRKLFHLDVYNFCDGLDDYAEDYTNFASLGDILTADMRLLQQRAENLHKEQSQQERADPQTTSIESTEEKAGDEPAVHDNDSNISEALEANDPGNSIENQSENHSKNRA